MHTNLIKLKKSDIVRLHSIEALLIPTLLTVLSFISILNTYLDIYYIELLV